MYNESAFWALVALAAIFCAAAGACLGINKLRDALACTLMAAALTVEAVNSHIGFKVQVLNTALRTVHSAALAQRTTPTTPFHVAFVVLLVLAALCTTFGRRQRAPQEWHNA